MNQADNFLYSTDLYTWVSVSGGEATIGFTNYSLDRMEEMVAVELQPVGQDIVQGEPCGSVDVMKALIDIPAPVSGTIVAINGAACESPEAIRQDPFGEGWLLKVRLSKQNELGGLLTKEVYVERGGL